jgi:indole-3-glycerol phosphate synthase
VAESGLAVPADAARLARAGYTLALVGTALMSTDDPATLARAMIAAGRGAATTARPEFA